MSVNIILTGLMGCGKSTIGKLLAKQIDNYLFVDIDDVIVNLEGISIPEIFKTKSESYFRNIEQQVIEDIAEEESLVIALGGGAFENKENRELLLAKGIVIYLKASVDTLFSRVKNDINRPLLQCDNPKEKLEELLKIREPNYLKAHITVDTDNKTTHEVIDEIIRKLEDNQ